MNYSKAFTGHDVFSDDLYVRIAIRTSLDWEKVSISLVRQKEMGRCTYVFVPKSNHMTKLMNHNAQLIAILSNTDRLWTVSSFAYKRATAKGFV